MPATISFAAHPVSAQLIVLRDPQGVEIARVEAPVGYELRVLRAPWWRRLRAWLSLQAWRARVAWGSL